MAKPDLDRQGHHGALAVATRPGDDERRIPPAPKGLSPATRKAWRTFWASDVALAADDVDMPALRRLFRNYDRYDRTVGLADKAPAVKGSTGQIRVNPLADHAVKLETAILRLENEFGMTPMSRARLGLTVSQAKLTAAELNRRTFEKDGDHDRDVIDAELLDEFAEA